MSIEKTNRKIIRQLCRTLASINSYRKTEEQRSASHSLENQIIKISSGLHDFPNDFAAELISTGSPKLHQWVSTKAPTVKLAGIHWTRLLKTSSPDHVIRLMKEKKIFATGYSIPMLGKIAAGETEWEKALFAAADMRQSTEHSFIMPKYRGLLTKPGLAPVAAAFLKLKVDQHYADYAEFAKNMTSNDEIFTPFLLMIAGIAPEDLVATSYQPVPYETRAHKFFKNIEFSSAHEKMEVLRIAPSVEAAIANEKAITEALRFRADNK